MDPLENIVEGISDFSKFVGLGPATPDETKPLIQHPVGSFKNYCSIAESAEGPILHTIRMRAAALAAAKLSRRAETINIKVDVCAPQESEKKDLLIKAQAAYNRAAKAKAFSGAQENDEERAKAWKQISDLYERAGSLFEKSADENLSNHETQKSIASAEQMRAKAEALERTLPKTELPPLDIEGDDDTKNCIIS